MHRYDTRLVVHQNQDSKNLPIYTREIVESAIDTAPVHDNVEVFPGYARMGYVGILYCMWPGISSMQGLGQCWLCSRHFTNGIPRSPAILPRQIEF